MKFQKFQKKPFRTIACTLLLLLSLLLIVLPVNAESVAEESLGTYIKSEYMDIDVEINDGYAITTVEEKLVNANNFSITDSFKILIPENAFMSDFSISIDGKEYPAEILIKEEARQQFEEAVSSGRTAGLLETRDSELFSYSLNFDAGQSIVIKMTYEQALTRDMGEYDYLQYLRSNHHVDDLTVSVDINSSTDVLSVETPEFASDINYPSPTSAHVEYSSNSLPSGDMNIIFKTENTDKDGVMKFYELNGTGYFMHVFSPTADDMDISPLNKDIIFLIDKSGSMSGERIADVKEAFSQVIGDLPEDDNFNVIFFDAFMYPYSEYILAANESNKQQATAVVVNTNANGGTNINEALLTAIDMFSAKSDNLPIIVFLTDGDPSEGVKSTAVIRQNVLEANNVDASIFTIAFGREFDYDFNFLQALSLENKGIAVYFEPDSEATEGITHFYETISTPLVIDLVLSYDDVTSDVVTTGKDHLFVGSESIVLGKYEADADEVTARASGSVRNGMYVSEHDFQVQSEEGNDFIPRLWAYNTIRKKLDMMKVEGETEELVSDVTDLSLEYGFVTPYTSFFVEIPQAEKKEEPVSEMAEDAMVESPEEEEETEEPVSESFEEAAIAGDESAVESTEDTSEAAPGFSSLMALCIIGFIVVVLKSRR